jgi:tetratricopeptide (TPR) repeat protein
MSGDPQRADKRLAYLEQLVASGKADSFARYALGLEYKGRGRVDDAIAAFDALRALDARYVPMYLMAGTALLDAGRKEEARSWLESGIEAAKQAGDSKALGELGDALVRCG